jgi:hypothetical protein
MDAHRQMGEHNIRAEDIEAAAEENGRSVAETWAIIDQTKAKDVEAHPSEYQGA